FFHAKQKRLEMVFSHLCIGVLEVPVVNKHPIDGNNHPGPISALATVNEHRLLILVGNNAKDVAYSLRFGSAEPQRHVHILHAQVFDLPFLTTGAIARQTKVDYRFDTSRAKSLQTFIVRKPASQKSAVDSLEI